MKQQFGTKIHRMSATDLVGRVVANGHGAEFQVHALELDAGTGTIVIELRELDEDGQPMLDTELGIPSLNGWAVY